MKKALQILVFGIVSGIIGGLTVHLLKEKPAKAERFVENQTPVNNNQFIGYKGILSESDFVKATEMSKNSVVFIKSRASVPSNYNIFDLYFGGGGGYSAATGSGVIFSEKGYIITNYHVIEGSDNIQVVYKKRDYPAKVIGYDRSTDLAVLKIEANDITPIKLGNSSETKIGQWVLAVGNPLNLDQTVTAGIISAKGRVINVVEGSFPIESFIQTDAAINPGNSGGALVNENGELVGINTAIVSETGSYSGYGFAVPVDIVKKVAQDLIKYGAVQKAIIGVNIQEMNDETISITGRQSTDGVYVQNIDPQSNAYKGGLRTGDVILSLDSKTINSAGEFNEQISLRGPGDNLKIKFARKNSIKETNITLLNEEGTTDIVKNEVYFSPSLGAELEVTSQALAKKLGISGGVKVVRLSSRGILRRLGIREGSIITSVNNVNVKTIEDLEYILEHIKGRVTIKATSEKGGQSYYSAYF